jgi:hypothetical protein
MTASRILRFGEGFSLEPASYEHFDLAQKWTEEDPAHAGFVQARFWLEQADDRDSYLARWKQIPVMFFKAIIYVNEERQKYAEVHMQFRPQITQNDHEMIRAVLLAGCPWLEELLLGAGIEEIIFDSNAPPLIAFCVKRLGFKRENGRLRKRLTSETIVH